MFDQLDPALHPKLQETFRTGADFIKDGFHNAVFSILRVNLTLLQCKLI